MLPEISVSLTSSGIAQRDSSISRLGPAVRAWFEATFEAPTPAQSEGWAAIAEGRHTLIHAPTGSGKTLAAFLWCIDRLTRPENAIADPTRAHLGVAEIAYQVGYRSLGTFNRAFKDATGRTPSEIRASRRP